MKVRQQDMLTVTMGFCPGGNCGSLLAGCDRLYQDEEPPRKQFVICTKSECERYPRCQLRRFYPSRQSLEDGFANRKWCPRYHYVFAEHHCLNCSLTASAPVAELAVPGLEQPLIPETAGELKAALFGPNKDSGCLCSRD